jgi:plasmid maintenance system antidote protein VapI
MVKDKRYGTIKKLIKAGITTSIVEILEIIPKTVIGRDMGMHHKTFDKLINNPENFTVKDMFRIASLIDIEKTTIVNLIVEDILARQNKRKK